MIHAYDKNYLAKAQTSFAVMLDYVVNSLKMSLNDFYRKFLNSEISSRFESGETSILVGMSGIELAISVTGDCKESSKYPLSFEKSPEYWTGWALAYFQWISGLSFRQINELIPISEICEMYNPYHEMDISQFCDYLCSLYNSLKGVTNLKKKRIEAGLSQSELASCAEVPVRTIQQYEQRQKNINNASVETVIRISKVLSCSVLELLECSTTDISNDNYF